MIKESICKNKVNVVGTISSEPKLAHSFEYADVYEFMVNIPRRSGVNDEIPVWITKDTLDRMCDITVGNEYEIIGEYRSYNELGTGRLILVLFAKEIRDEFNFLYNNNNVTIEGYIVKALEPRKTPLGKETIVDIIVAVNRFAGKSSYLPCIIWNPDEELIESLSVGKKVHINGRLQSRKYLKVYEDETSEYKTAYEISVFNIYPMDE